MTPLELAIAAYHDGTLDAVGSQLLVEAMRGPDAAAVRERIAFDGLLGQAFTSDDAVVRSVRERLDGERSASAVVRAVRGSLAVTTRRQRRTRRAAWRPRLMTAALVLLMVGVVGWLFVTADAERPLCRLMAMDPVMVVRHAKSVPVTPGAGLYAGDRLHPTTAVTLVWQDGSRLLLQPNALVVLRTTRSDHGVSLEVGTLSAEVAKQRPDRSFVITTAEARVEVMGTRFQVIAGTQRTQVDLHQGSVRLTRASDGRALTLRADEFAVVAASEDFAVRSRTTPAPTPAPAPAPAAPAESAWKPLFAATNLAGWEQQHGTWNNTHGVVRGSDPQHGKARLLGRHPFADLELNCRLRITGVDFAEVQVGNYNWFVEVPAHGAQWIQVEVRQRGEHLSITADGVTLKNNPGDGAAMRAGPLAFYVMPGGTLEIADAQFRIPKSATPATR